MILPLCCSCTVLSPVYASYGKYEITRNMYEYWIAYYKSVMISEYEIDESQYDNVWSQSVDGKTTLEQNITDYVDSMVDDMLICAELFDQLGLSKNAAIKKQMNEVIDELINNDIKAASSLSALNGILGNYGMNKDTLRKAIEFEVKTSIVTNKLFGEGGDHAVTDGEREQYYQQNYRRIKQIGVFNTEKYVFDENGDPKIDIYTGRYMTQELTEEEKEEKNKLAADIYERVKNGEDFEALLDKYNEDSIMLAFPDGLYVSTDSYYFAYGEYYYVYETPYLASALTLQPGETSLVEVSDGYYIIKSYPLDAGMWQNENNSPFFSEMEANIISQKKPEVFGDKYAKITRDNEYRQSFKITDIAPLDSSLIYTSEQ